MDGVFYVTKNGKVWVGGGVGANIEDKPNNTIQ